MNKQKRRHLRKLMQSLPRVYVVYGTPVIRPPQKYTPDQDRAEHWNDAKAERRGKSVYDRVTEETRELPSLSKARQYVRRTYGARATVVR